MLAISDECLQFAASLFVLPGDHRGPLASGPGVIHVFILETCCWIFPFVLLIVPCYLLWEVAAVKGGSICDDPREWKRS